MELSRNLPGIAEETERPRKLPLGGAGLKHLGGTRSTEKWLHTAP